MLTPEIAETFVPGIATHAQLADRVRATLGDARFTELVAAERERRMRARAVIEAEARSSASAVWSEPCPFGQAKAERDAVAFAIACADQEPAEAALRAAGPDATEDDRALAAAFDTLPEGIARKLYVWAWLDEAMGITEGRMGVHEQMTHDKRRMTAIHEAAHAVAFVRLCPDQDAGATSIEPDATTVGRHLSESLVDRYAGGAVPEAATQAYITVLLAGYCAELAAGSTHADARPTAGSDFEHAAELRGALALSEAECLAIAHAFVAESANWRAILAVADELLERTTLDAEEVDFIVEIADGRMQPEALQKLRAKRKRS